MLEQSKRRFLEKVDFNTCPGYFDGKPGRREEAGMRPDTGPCAVITDLAEYVFVDREVTLKSVHAGAGVTLEKVRAETGWDIKISRDLMDTLPPSDEELRILRERVRLAPTAGNAGAGEFRDDLLEKLTTSAVFHRN